jgi:CDP-paratose 2-epimerase
MKRTHTPNRQVRSAVAATPKAQRQPSRTPLHDRPILITGGSGFIGTNLADRLLSSGQPVLVYDNLSRPGVERNLEWLRSKHGARLAVEIADVRDAHALRLAVQRAKGVFHLAAQVAVTTSLTNPVHDFDVNARGTINLLEAIRHCDAPPPLVFTSTNKVYGGLSDVPLVQRDGRYEPADPQLSRTGIDESRPLDFHSPYGCSKGAADQYVLDYARSFGLPTCVFRMSCIYGPHQCGSEDQGWVAHFLIKALKHEPITLYGDGRQVRDILFVEDLVDALLTAQSQALDHPGRAYNIGGGPANTTSLLELVDLIERLTRHRLDVRHSSWRPGDQRYYVSDTKRAQQSFDWRPSVGVVAGVTRLCEWLREAHEVDHAQSAEWRDRTSVGIERRVAS